MCYLSKKPSKYFSFCDTVFSSWGRSGRICYLPYCFIPKRKKNRKKERKKGTPPWYVNVGGHPMENLPPPASSYAHQPYNMFIGKVHDASMPNSLQNKENPDSPRSAPIDEGLTRQMS
jgi:hypothetical protein